MKYFVLYVMLLYTLFYTISSVKMRSIDSNNGLSLNSVGSLNSAKKHNSVSMLIRLKICFSLNSAVSLNSAAIVHTAPIASTEPASLRSVSCTAIKIAGYGPANLYVCCILYIFGFKDHLENSCNAICSLKAILG